MKNEVTKCANCKLCDWIDSAYQRFDSAYCNHPKKNGKIVDDEVIPEDCPLREEPFIVKLKENNDN